MIKRRTVDLAGTCRDTGKHYIGQGETVEVILEEDPKVKILITAREYPNDLQCKKCVLIDESFCHKIACMRIERQDGTSVALVQVRDKAQEEFDRVNRVLKRMNIQP